MCLVVVAHRVSPGLPLVLAANRDEDHLRPTLGAHWWDDAPHVLGGRDALQGGSWLAVTRSGRFAAVTNLRGAAPRPRSRGALVREFVTSRVDAAHFASAVLRDAGDYSGFHLLLGDEAGALVYVSSDAARELEPGIHAFSNAPAGEEWPKVGLAADAMSAALQLDRSALPGALLAFLSTPGGAGDPMSDVFIAGERYGTRSSTVVLVAADEIVFVEQSWLPGGVSGGPGAVFRSARAG